MVFDPSLVLLIVRYFKIKYRKTCNTTRGLYLLLDLTNEGYIQGRVVLEV